jgi:AraC-like DNA-binding protein
MKALFEKIIPLESNSFKAYSYEMDEFDNPWHFHPEYELTYILSSQGVRYTGNSFENFEKDDLVLLGPNLPHCWKNTGPQIHKAGAIVVHWDKNLLGNEWIEKCEFQNIRKLFELSGKGLRFDADFARAMKPKLEAFLDLTSFHKLISLLEILNDLALTAKVNSLCDSTFHEQLKFDDHERINTIHQFVRSKYAEKITLNNIADHVHMGPESFSRFFSKIMNKPFFSFLNEYRVNAACKLLIESDLQVTQISYACGFESLPFFYRQFKKYKGNSPNQYRMAYQKISFSLPNSGN